MPIELGVLPGRIWTISTTPEGDANAIVMTAADPGKQGWLPYRKEAGEKNWTLLRDKWASGIVALPGGRTVLWGAKEGDTYLVYPNDTQKWVGNGAHHIIRGTSGKIVKTSNYGGKNHRLWEYTGWDGAGWEGHKPQVDGHIVGLTSDDRFWITNNLEQLWEQVGGGFQLRRNHVTWVAVGFDDSVWAVQSGSGIYNKFVGDDDWYFLPIARARSVHAAPDGEMLVCTIDNTVLRILQNGRIKEVPMQEMAARPPTEEEMANLSGYEIPTMVPVSPEDSFDK